MIAIDRCNGGAAVAPTERGHCPVGGLDPEAAR